MSARVSHGELGSPSEDEVEPSHSSFAEPARSALQPLCGRLAVDVLTWSIAGVLLLLWRLYPHFTPALNHDSFQYLSGAVNTLQGHWGWTSLIHFDAERSFGTVPAPIPCFGLHCQAPAGLLVSSHS